MMEILKHGSHVEVLVPEWIQKNDEEIIFAAQIYKL